MQNDHEELPRVLTVEEAGEILRVSRSMVYELIRQQKIPSIKLGRRRLIPKEELLETITKMVEEVS